MATPTRFVVWKHRVRADETAPLSYSETEISLLVVGMALTLIGVVARGIIFVTFVATGAKDAGKGPQGSAKYDTIRIVVGYAFREDT